MANTAHGHVTNEFKRQSKRQTTSMVNAWVDASTPAKTEEGQGEAGAQTQEQVTDGWEADSGEPGTTSPGNAARTNVIHRKWHHSRSQGPAPRRRSPWPLRAAYGCSVSDRLGVTRVAWSCAGCTPRARRSPRKRSPTRHIGPCGWKRRPPSSIGKPGSPSMTTASTSTPNTTPTSRPRKGFGTSRQ